MSVIVLISSALGGRRGRTLVPTIGFGNNEKWLVALRPQLGLLEMVVNPYKDQDRDEHHNRDQDKFQRKR